MIARAALALLLTTAWSCANDETSTPVVADAAPDTATNETGSRASGTLGERSFVVESGAFSVANGKLHLILSSKADECGQLTAKRVPAGAMQLEIYDIPGTTAGRYASPRTQGAHVAESCAPGTKITESQLAYFQEATAAQVTIATIDATHIDGSIDVAFADGSHVVGSFTASACAARPSDGAVCN
jgi:hypothetical protein